jgi:hypothetical protein
MMFICVDNHKHNEDTRSKMMSDNSVILSSCAKVNFVRNLLVYKFHGIRTNRIQKRLDFLCSLPNSLFFLDSEAHCTIYKFVLHSSLPSLLSALLTVRKLACQHAN